MHKKITILSSYSKYTNIKSDFSQVKPIYTEVISYKNNFN
ncbi:hypothetical protein PMI10_01851 [Flavobacterium sp. CF136]|nr:hypothetical protein PMI10_01851 [Flavobacterium sp. CF136]